MNYKITAIENVRDYYIIIPVTKRQTICNHYSYTFNNLTFLYLRNANTIGGRLKQ